MGSCRVRHLQGTTVAAQPEVAVTPPHDPLLTVRAALVLLLSILAGLGAGVLGHLSGQSLPQAVLLGAGAAAGVLAVGPSLIR